MNGLVRKNKGKGLTFKFDIRKLLSRKKSYFDNKEVLNLLNEAHLHGWNSQLDSSLYGVKGTQKAFFNKFMERISKTYK